ncbi:unnamed protein product, partial [Notodromas monacha]
NDFFASSDDHPQFPPVPKWIWLIVAINVFLAHTLDGIDGKQARRTKTSGPLGELFDHGLDSWTTVFIPTCLYSVFGRSDFSISPWRMYFCLWNVFACFFLSHWEKYNTGCLFLPWGYDYSMVSSMIVFFLTFVAGHGIWKFEVPIAGQAVPAGGLFELLMYCRLIVHQMCGTRCNTFNITLVPLMLGAFVVALVPQSVEIEYVMLQLTAAVVTLYHLFYGVCVVRQMCNHFNIMA